jgi:hypothetical protein
MSVFTKVMNVCMKTETGIERTITRGPSFDEVAQARVIPAIKTKSMAVCTAVKKSSSSVVAAVKKTTPVVKRVVPAPAVQVIDPVGAAIDTCSDVLHWMLRNPTDNTVGGADVQVACTVRVDVPAPKAAAIPVPMYNKTPSHREHKPSVLRQVVAALAGPPAPRGPVVMAQVKEINNA